MRARPSCDEDVRPVAGRGVQQRERNALGGAQAERDAFQAAGFGVEGFGFGEGVAERVDLRDVARGVRDVFRADGTEGGNGGRAEAEVILAAPVALVVRGVHAGPGVVRGFVVLETLRMLEGRRPGGRTGRRCPR